MHLPFTYIYVMHTLQGDTYARSLIFHTVASPSWGTCPSKWRLCPTSAGAPGKYRCRMSSANLALNVRKGVEIELHSIAICIFRITRPVIICSPDLHVCRKYYSDLTLHSRMLVAKAWPKCSNSRRRYGLK